MIVGRVRIDPYSFDSQSFAIRNLQAATTSYEYSYDAKNAQKMIMPQLPRYDLTVPATLNSYKPASIEAAKKIEAARAAAGGELMLRTFVQVSNASIGRDQVLEVKGTVSGIEIADSRGNVIFEHFAK